MYEWSKIIDGIVNDQALAALVFTTIILTLADLVMGVAMAIRTGTFKPDLVGEFISSHVVGRVFPIIAVGFLGHFEPALFAIAAAAAAAYTVETLGSIRESFNLPAQIELEGMINDAWQAYEAGDGPSPVTGLTQAQEEAAYAVAGSEVP